MSFDQRPAASTATPAQVDVVEHEESVTVLVDLPGVIRDDLEIAYEKGELTICGGVSRSRNGALLHEERAGELYRSFRLSDSLDAEAIDARLENGVSTLEIPTSATARPRKITDEIA